MPKESENKDDIKTDVDETEIETKEGQATEDEAQEGETEEQESQTEDEDNEAGDADKDDETPDDEEFTVNLDGTDTEDDSDIGEDSDDDSAEFKKVRSIAKKERQASRKSKKRIARLEQELKEARAKSEPDSGLPKLGDRPDRFDYDTDEAYNTAQDKWYDTKRQHDEAAAKQEQVRKDREQQWNADHKRYAEHKAAINVPDYEDSVKVVEGSLSIAQQAMIVEVCAYNNSNAAQMLLGLAQNPKHLASLAKIENPIKFAGAIGKLTTKLQSGTQKKKPSPEKKIRGGRFDSTNELARLEKEADRTGDRTKVQAFKREMRKLDKG